MDVYVREGGMDGWMDGWMEELSEEILSIPPVFLFQNTVAVLQIMARDKE